MASSVPHAAGVPKNQTAFCAPTGKAASVLSGRLEGARATTIHSLLYTRADQHCDACPLSSRKPPAQQRSTTRCHDIRCESCRMRWTQPRLPSWVRLVVVDEASMVAEQVYHDLTTHDRPVVFLGDHGQLPPVASSFSVMAPDHLDARLETVHRQVAGSPILGLAMHVRRTGALPPSWPGVSITPECILEIPDDLSWSSHRLLLCGKNITRHRLNQAIRSLRGLPADHPAIGDRLVCLRNNAGAKVINGQLGTLVELADADAATWQAEIEVAGDQRYTGLISRAQFGATGTLDDLPRDVDLWDYGYALTVHKAQGSEANRVHLLEERLGSTDHARWLYTAITRAKHKLTITALGAQ